MAATLGVGEWTLGAFVVNVSDTTDSDEIRNPWRVPRSLLATALSALLHASLALTMAVMAGTSRTDGGAAHASALAAMKGYLARSSEREQTVRLDDAPPRIALASTAEPLGEPLVSPPPVPSARGSTGAENRARGAPSAAQGLVARGPVVAAPSAHPRRWSGDSPSRDAIGAAAGPFASAQPGDWYGSYLCGGEELGLVLHIDWTGDTLAAFGTATNPHGVHSSYRQHGMRNPATGEVSFYNEGWVGEPMDGYTLTGGMHGRFTGDLFTGVIDDPRCQSITLRRRT